jgi:hypothetical protein
MMNFVPGLGIVKGMALTLRRFFEPKATIRYPEVPADVAPKWRGRLQLLYDEYGTLKCETCFQCAQACPIECIDMGGMDTKGRYHIHWGAPETYGERREESALRRSGRPVPDAAYAHFRPVDSDAVDEILARYDYDPKHMLAILEDAQTAFGHLPVAALKLISQKTGAWYAMIYGTASYYRHPGSSRPPRPSRARPSTTIDPRKGRTWRHSARPSREAAARARRRAPDHGRDPPHAGRLAAHPARPGRRTGPGRPRCRGRRRRVRGAATRHP